MIYVTSDLHGYPLQKFKSLLSRAGFCDDDFLYVLGDAIDRGENSVEILMWLMNTPNAELILGNHEKMLLDCAFLFEEVTDEALDNLSMDKLINYQKWLANGAKPTLDALKKLYRRTLRDILDYISDAPLYATVSISNKNFLLVHSGLNNFSPDKKISQYTEHDLLWTRPDLNTLYSDKFVTVFGHTPTCLFGEQYKGKMLKTDTWIDVDMGACCGFAPMLLRLDDMKEFYLNDQSTKNPA